MATAPTITPSMAATSVPPNMATSGDCGGSGITSQFQAPIQYGRLMVPTLARWAQT